MKRLLLGVGVFGLALGVGIMGISYASEASQVRENFFEKMVTQIFGKPRSVSQSSTVDISALIRTFELRIALGG